MLPSDVSGTPAANIGLLLTETEDADPDDVEPAEDIDDPADEAGVTDDTATDDAGADASLAADAIDEPGNDDPGTDDPGFDEPGTDEIEEDDCWPAPPPPPQPLNTSSPLNASAKALSFIVMTSHGVICY